MTRDLSFRDFMMGKGPSADELAAAQEYTPDPRANNDMANQPFVSGDFDRDRPPKDAMRRYWRQYETTPIVREPINDFARRVIEPGYRVTGEPLSKSQTEKLENWLQEAAVLEKEPGNDIYSLIRKAVIQMQVRGTAVLEKIYAEEDKSKLYGLGFLSAENVRTNSRPGTPLLLLPGDESVYGDIPVTDDGTAAAYTEYPNAELITEMDPNSEKVNNYTFDDIIKLPRDADVNESYGTSRLEACSDAIENLKQKMNDNAEAIASKAYPLWLFMFGTEEQPWDRGDIDSFMTAHEMDNFHPGLKQGVRGDVSVETISGEVADIADYLQFDVDYIMSAMPLPKFTLGAFEQDINKSVTKAQERSVSRQIKDARREIEKKFHEFVQEKAKEMFDLTEDQLEKIEFKLGIKGEEKQVEKPDQNVIDYKGKNQNSDDGETGSSSSSSEARQTVWDVDLTDAGVEELADPRLVSTSDVSDDVSSLVDTVLGQFRDRLIQRLREDYSNAPESASMAFEGMANTELNTLLRNRDFDQQAKVLFTEAVTRTHDTLAQDNQTVDLDPSFGVNDRQRVNSATQRLQRETRTALEDLVDQMATQLDRGVASGDSLDNIIQRFEDKYGDVRLESRSHVIARMNVQRVVEETKLAEFEKDDGVAGVKVINPCTESTTHLCENLAGCGAGVNAMASFEGDATLSDQWTDQADGAYIFEGFEPIPAVPPFHYNCRSELVPVTADELAEAQASEASACTTCGTDDGLTDVEDLESKYDIKVDDI